MSHKKGRSNVSSRKDQDNSQRALYRKHVIIFTGMDRSLLKDGVRRSVKICTEKQPEQEEGDSETDERRDEKVQCEGDKRGFHPAVHRDKEVLRVTDRTHDTAGGNSKCKRKKHQFW